jgi:hypothetical protein
MRQIGRRMQRMSDSVSLDKIIQDIVDACGRGEKTPVEARDEIVKLLDFSIASLEANDGSVTVVLPEAQKTL